MKRDLSELANTVFDVLIVGGGIYGACTVWDATLRGVSAALLEKGDFGSATSANSLKIIHGGLRYLQHADIRRMRESIRERRTLMRIAPHLVHPLPVLVPIYGHGMRGKDVWSLGMAVNDLIGFDRNRLADPQKHIPRGRTISRTECLKLLPGIHERGLTGGAVFHDAQVYNSERLLLAFLRSSEMKGACLANYVEAIGFLRERDGVTGVEAKDVLTGDRFDIRARTVVNTAGPWVDSVLGLLNGSSLGSGVRFAKAINLVTRPLYESYAVGSASQNSYFAPDAAISRGSRLLFITPWRGRSLIGTAYTAHDKDPGDLKVTERDIQGFVDEINAAWPSVRLNRQDLYFVHGGLIPITGTDRKTGDLRLAKHHRIHDHRQEGVGGLISVVGVKYTTARHVAEKVVDLAFETWGKRPPESWSSVHRLHGGDIDRFETYLSDEVADQPCGLEEDQVTRLVRNYGAAYGDVLRHLDREDRAPAHPDHLAVLRAECLHGIRDEMALKLSDVVLRRTELGTAGRPEDGIVTLCAEVMAKELGWSRDRMQEEIQQVEEAYAWGSKQ